LIHLCFHGDPRSANLQSWILSLVRHHPVRITVLALGTGMGSVGPVPVVDLPFPPRLGPVRFGLALPFVRRAVRRIAPDVLIGYRIPSYGVLASFTGFRPVVVVAQSETELWPPALALKRMLLRRILPRADLIQVWAPTMVASLLEAGARAEQILCLPRGIEVDDFNPGRDLTTRPFARGGSPRENPPGPVRLIVTRTLHEDYNHTQILQALARLQADGFDARLDIVGDGPLRAALEAQAERLAPGTVRFLGKVPHAELPALLAASDLYLSTPITEGLSASLVEAMACGLFPIVTDHPGNRHVIEDRMNGILVRVGDAAALAAAIREAWSSPVLRAAAVVRNRRFVEAEMRAENNLGQMLERYGALG
jgi:glycosyltransferase involved in cell wall biosynthesis